jgi:hypothetical protein
MGKVNSLQLLVKKITCNHEFFLMYWIYMSNNNMMIIFHFIFWNLKKPILKVGLSKKKLNVSACTKCLILQNGLHVDDFFFFEIFNLVEL